MSFVPAPCKEAVKRNSRTAVAMELDELPRQIVKPAR
jgi:hypothetical protein